MGSGGPYLVNVCSNANPLHYYALRVPRKADRWRCVVYFRFTHRLGRPHYVWDEYLYSVLEEVEVRVTVCVSICVVYLCCGVWNSDERKGEGENLVLAYNLLVSKSAKGATRHNVPIRRTNRYQ